MLHHTCINSTRKSPHHINQNQNITVCYIIHVLIQQGNHLIISIRSFHKFRIFILIFKIINFPPISLKIINLMENICISLTYYVLNIFDCIKLIHSMETTFESLCFIIICSLGNFHHYVSYVIIFILLINHSLLYTIYYTLQK